MSDDVRTSIMDAADTAFAHFGYKKTSVEDVARSAGIGKGTMYLHFESKEALFDACIRRKRDESLSSIVTAVTKVRAKGAEAQLRAFITAKLEQPMRFFAAFDLKLAPLLDLTEHVLRMWPEQEAREAVVLEQILAVGVHDGTFSIDDPAMVARGMVSLIGGVSLRNVVNGPDAKVQRAEQATFDVLVSGLLQPPNKRKR